MSEEIKVKVNGREVQVPKTMTILQACEAAGEEIPRFCYHERLSVAGNCRMCLVEVAGSPKPVASCAMPVAADMEINTQSETVEAARNGVMEFLLINHPLDCPICDQGGECDLQDQAFGYGFDASRFADNKRAVEDKYMGPLVKTIMTRCIHCTRCVRFANEVAGVDEIGAIGRGEDMEITTYLEASLESELSGNVIDLCPVGALTSKPYAFTARPWELSKTETIDVMDALGANIRVDMRGREAMRILPRNADDINEEWISDKTRFIFDGLNTQRLDVPYIKSDGKLATASWDAAFAAVATKINGDSVAAIAGDLVCAEGQFALKTLLDALGCEQYDCRQDGAAIDTTSRANYIFNAGIAGIDSADAILLIGTNPRLEAAVLNARILRAVRERNVPVFGIGTPADLTYNIEWLGGTPKTIAAFNEKEFMDAKNPMVILGQGALQREDDGVLNARPKVSAVQAAAIELANKAGASFNMLHTAAARVAGLDIGFTASNTADILAGCKSGAIKTLILYGADEINMADCGDAFVIYIGSHGDAGAHRADVILPAAAFTEKQAIYANTEGRAQMSERATLPPSQAREDWKIFRALADELKVSLGFDSLAELRQKLFAAAPQLATLDELTDAGAPKMTATTPPLTDAPLANAITNFYFTNPIARASSIMAECDKAKQNRVKQAAE